MPRICLAALALVATACSDRPNSEPREAVTTQPPPDTNKPAEAAGTAPDPQPAETRLIAERLILAEWAKAENRATCAPLAFSDDGDARGTPRHAQFSGGWAVAFDLPATRSAYGLAGVGSLPQDNASDVEKRDILINQWPSFRDLSALPQPAYAGYGVVGAKPWPGDNPQAVGLQALAYVRVGGQQCLYNVWSRLGRRHLEEILESLRTVGKRG